MTNAEEVDHTTRSRLLWDMGEPIVGIKGVITAEYGLYFTLCLIMHFLSQNIYSHIFIYIHIHLHV